MVHQTTPLPFLSFFPSQRHVSSRPRVDCKAACAEKEKNKPSLATLYRVYHSLFCWYRHGTKNVFSLYLLYLFETREREKERYGGRVSTPLDELQYAGGRNSGYRRAQHRLVGFTVCIHVPPSQRGRCVCVCVCV